MATAEATSEPTTPRKNFFVSYNRADRAWAEWIAWQLEEANYTTVLQAWDFGPGSNFVVEMDRAASAAERTIAVLSPDYLTSLYTRPEWAAAFAQDPTGTDRRLVPVRVRACTLTGLLAQVVYLDLVGLAEPAAKTTLLNGLKQGRGKPEAAPTFPGAPLRTVPERPRFPGGLPSIWNVPHSRNPNFAGREDLLADLSRILNAGEAAAVTQAITGLGGIGKTQLATEYAYRYASNYALVWWMRAEEPATLTADYAALATALELVSPDMPDQSALVTIVGQWLQQHRDWLLVFDNAGAPAEVRSYIPLGGAGHALVTSRQPAWGGLARVVSVPVLPRMVATSFLLKRTGQADEAAAGALAQALGDLPLALEQAGAYMETTGRSLGQYLALFRAESVQVLKAERSRPGTDYPATVVTTWKLALAQVQRKTRAGAALLNLCAFLAPEAFPVEVIRSGAGLLPRDLGPAVQDDLAWDEALGALRDYSLVEVSGDVLSMHRLVQAVARDRLPPTARRRWAEAAVQLVDDAFPFVEVQTWPTCAQLLPHALIVSGHAQTLQVGDEPAGRLLNQVGFYLQHSGDNARGSLGPGPRGPTDPSRYPVAPGEHRTAAKVPA